MTKEDTRQKILQAFTGLIIKHGYESTTTQKIAQDSSVSENTVFRHFKDKRGLLNALLTEYLMDLKDLQSYCKLTENLEEDLLQIATNYQTFMSKHEAIVMTGLRDSLHLPEVREASEQISLYFKELTGNYLTQMKDKGRIAKVVDVKTQAINFVWINFGYFMTRKNRPAQLNISELQQHIGAFILGLSTPQ
ncbi:MAG: TetR/AcrR family transcriptional regulator [Sporolactobacillus sp.]